MAAENEWFLDEKNEEKGEKGKEKREKTKREVEIKSKKKRAFARVAK